MKEVLSESKVVVKAPFDAEYEQWKSMMRLRLLHNMAQGPLFRTDASGLMQVYLDALPAEWRQYHTCSCCHRFLSEYGGLVVIHEDGCTVPAFWDINDAAIFYAPAAAALQRAVAKAKVKGVFLTSEATLGVPVTGPWTHFAANMPAESLWNGRVLTANQRAAERLQDFITVQKALDEFSAFQLEQGVRLCKSEAMYRTDKVLGPMEWLYNLRVATEASKGFKRNLVWRAIATAPAGFCHPRSSMAGTILDDIATGYEFAAIKKRFDAKMHPLDYQRPKAPPTTGAVQAAEKLVEQLGIQRSLLRRYATFEDILDFYWQPTAPAAPSKPSGSMFSHLVTKDKLPVKPIALPATRMTWLKFQAEILPLARTLELYVASAQWPFAGLVTAVHPDAPPIIQWDLAERRNPVSWYMYSDGSYPAQWGLGRNTYAEIKALTPSPAKWLGFNAPNFSDAVFVVVKGMRDANHASMSLFPEILKSELHGVRSVIEAYSKAGKLEGRELESACGLVLSDKNWGIMLRVNGDREYILDRWD